MCMCAGELQHSLISFCYVGNSNYRGITPLNQGGTRYKETVDGCLEEVLRCRRRDMKENPVP